MMKGELRNEAKYSLFLLPLSIWGIAQWFYIYDGQLTPGVVMNSLGLVLFGYYMTDCIKRGFYKKA